MRAGLAIEAIKGIKMTAIDKQMYEMAMLMRDIERKLLEHYSDIDEVSVTHFTELLQVCLDKLPEEQSLLIKPILRELKLSQILK
jgi:hypothetical protein